MFWNSNICTIDLVNFWKMKSWSGTSFQCPMFVLFGAWGPVWLVQYAMQFFSKVELSTSYGTWKIRENLRICRLNYKHAIWALQCKNNFGGSAGCFPRRSAKGIAAYRSTCPYPEVHQWCHSLQPGVGIGAMQSQTNSWVIFLVRCNKCICGLLPKSAYIYI